MNILVTNDDGYTEGLKILLEVAKKFGDAYAIIPEHQESAVGKGLTLHKTLRLHNLKEDVYTLNGKPADCVLFSLYSKEFKKPDLVLSGINFGDNSTLSAILGSGTIGACWEATLEGVKAIAFSMHRSSKDWRNKTNWGNKEKLTEAVEKIIKEYLNHIEPDTLLSVNLPNEFSSTTKIVISHNPQRLRFTTGIEKRTDPSGMPYYWLHGDFSKSEKDTDLYEVAVNKNIVITPLTLNFVKKSL
ncbi:MAG: 5'/3'-nucleotidase SurE [Candidatus Micrarchaeota archaeon]|nr:5'/3'-nucleotidase SurE [Candidatus Micrarchaeota archaeon]